MQTTTTPGKHADGGGLYLIVDSSGAKRWLFIFRFDGRQPEMGLGSFPAVSLAEAREARDAAEKLVRAGQNPIEVRNQAKAASQSVPTFGDFSSDLVDDIEGGFRNLKHRQQWRSTLKTYCATMSGKLVDRIGTDDVLECLKPIWQTKPETASRVRGRIERVLDAAKAKGLRVGENPARWRGHLDALLPKRHRLTRGHHAALPFDAVPAFVGRLRQVEGMSALALEFCILTCARSGEVLGARWSEIDLKGKVWTVPAQRMKAGREHRVPLGVRALEILSEMEKVRQGEFVFPGQSKGRPLSVMAMEMALRRMKVTDATVHGFRSSFRDWCGECTQFPRELAEAALAHTVGDAVERAYRRGDALERRRALMDAWTAFVEPKPANVVTLVTRAKA